MRNSIALILGACLLPACVESEKYAQVYAEKTCNRMYWVRTLGTEYYCKWVGLDRGLDCIEKMTSYRISKSKPAPAQPPVYTSIVWGSNLVHIKLLNLECDPEEVKEQIP